MTAAERGGAEPLAGPPSPPWRKSRRGPSARPPRQPLSQDLIVETALKILQAEGLDAVSMRRVAQDLNTGPASLYAHVSGKDELLELMLDRVAGEVRLPEPRPDRWQEQIKEMARESRRVLRRYRDISLVSLANIPTGRNQMVIVERMLEILLSAGVPPQIAAWSLDRLALYIDADCYEGSIYEAKLQGRDIEDFWAEYRRQLVEYFRGLSAEGFPRIGSMAETLTTGGDDERFEFGLDLIVRGVESYITER